MDRRTTLASLAALTAVAPAPASEPGPVLVELFTSQGCNSCPRADAALARLVGRPDVLPLAFHVTYWDRLGWRDTLGDPRCDQRQRWYAGLLGTGAYTPQMVIAGEIDLVGSDPRLDQALDLAAAHRMPARVSFADRVTAVLPAVPVGGAARLTAVSFDPHHRVRIERGENAGREIDYVNAVRALADLGTWNGAARPVSLAAVAAGGRGLALIAQLASTGEVIALGAA
jgi:hypothetical protein